MVPLLADLRTDGGPANKRGTARRALRLEVVASSQRDAATALIHNLSERGLLIETTVALAIGEMIHVDLPESKASEARVVWIKGLFFGCEFVEPVSKASVSAALLLAPPTPSRSMHESAGAAGLNDYEVGKPWLRLSEELEKPLIRIAAVVSLSLTLFAVLTFLYALLKFRFAI